MAIDRRVKRTQKLLAKALITLTLAKGYNAVTIREITELADVGYATFFRHYADKNALLHDTLDVVLEELMQILPPGISSQTSPLVGIVLFRYVQEHNELIQVLLSSSEMIQHVVATATTHMLEQNPNHLRSSIPHEIAAFHVITSSISLIGWWLEHQMIYPPEQMGQIYFDLILQPSKIRPLG